MQFHDAASIDGTRRTRDNYLVAKVRIARAGNIQLYSGSELGRDDMETVRVYRPETAIFDTKSMSSFCFRPVTRLHPSENVTADTFKSASVVGITGGEPARDGEHLTIPMLLMDGETIVDVLRGMRELSCGYTVDLLWEKGSTPSGDAYDAKVESVIGNHVAIVPKGRAGSTCRIGDAEIPDIPFDRDALLRALSDSKTDQVISASPVGPANMAPFTAKERPMADDSMRAVLLDGITVRTNDAGAEAIQRLQKHLTDAATAHATMLAEAKNQIKTLSGQMDGLRAAHASDMEAAMAAKDGAAAAIASLKASHDQAITAKDGEIAGYKAQVPDVTALDAMLASRLATAEVAARVYGPGFDPRGKSEAEMRRIAVAKRLGDAFVVDKAELYVGGVFDSLAENTQTATSDPVRDALAAGGGGHAKTAPVVTDWSSTSTRAPEAWAANIDNLRNGWKQPSASSKGGH